MNLYQYSVGHGPAQPHYSDSLDVALRYVSRHIERSDFPDSDPLCTLNVNVSVWSPSEHLAKVVELPPVEPECSGLGHHWIDGETVMLGSAMKRTGVCLRCDFRRHSYQFRTGSPDYVRYEAC